MVLPLELTRLSVERRTHFHIQLRLRMGGICLQCFMHFHDVVLNHKDRFFITLCLLRIFYVLEASQLPILQITQF